MFIGKQVNTNISYQINQLRGRCRLHHYLTGETEAYRREETCPRSEPKASAPGQDGICHQRPSSVPQILHFPHSTTGVDLPLVLARQRASEPPHTGARNLSLAELSWTLSLCWRITHRSTAFSLRQGMRKLGVTLLELTKP